MDQAEHHSSLGRTGDSELIMDKLEELKRQREDIKPKADLFSRKYKDDNTVWHQMLDRIEGEITRLEMEQAEDLYKE